MASGSAHGQEGQVSPIIAARFSPEGERIVVVHASGEVCWYSRGGEELGRIAPHGTTYVSAEFSPDGAQVLLVPKTGPAVLCDIEKGTSVQLQAASRPPLLGTPEELTRGSDPEPPPQAPDKRDKGRERVVSREITEKADDDEIWTPNITLRPNIYLHDEHWPREAHWADRREIKPQDFSTLTANDVLTDKQRMQFQYHVQIRQMDDGAVDDKMAERNRSRRRTTFEETEDLRPSRVEDLLKELPDEPGFQHGGE